MAEKCGFSDPEDDALCFSLNECTDGATIQRALGPEREILAIMETWFDKPGAKFVFQLKLYTESLVTSKDPKIVHMMFIQACYNVIIGTYPTTEKEVVLLAALQFQAKFGLHNSASHKPGFLKHMIVRALRSGGVAARQAAASGGERRRWRLSTSVSAVRITTTLAPTRSASPPTPPPPPRNRPPPRPLSAGRVRAGAAPR